MLCEPRFFVDTGLKRCYTRARGGEDAMKGQRIFLVFEVIHSCHRDTFKYRKAFGDINDAKQWTQENIGFSDFIIKHDIIG
jgi:hypothetical protein